MYALANLCRNQPKKVAMYGEMALMPQLSGGLKPDEKEGFFKLLVNAYRQLNDRPRAEFYLEQHAAMRSVTQPDRAQ